ncbi:ABC transporter ATP-binding protein [Flagellimonas sp.]|uniref:ABC transporter ATP-binding protein n=1 Tax=Flagellimonas sp. TaxID=2058762 RepID=UPI003B50EDD4
MINITNINKKYASGKNEVVALDNINLNIDTSEFVLIKGESGSGKSTLLFILGGMLKPSSGEVNINGKSLFELSEKERTNYRANEIGFVFQSYHLLPYLNVLDNILLSNKLNGTQIPKDEVVSITEELGIKERLNHKPSELSSGEKQRTALARAMITEPSIILADEPTGNLDEKNAREVMNFLQAFQRAGGTVIMVTHGNLADEYASRIIYLNKGKIIDQS